MAAECGHEDVADILLLHKAFANAKSKIGLTPLHLAAQNGWVIIIIIGSLSKSLGKIAWLLWLSRCYKLASKIHKLALDNAKKLSSQNQLEDNSIWSHFCGHWLVARFRIALSYVFIKQVQQFSKTSSGESWSIS